MDKNTQTQLQLLHELCEVLGAATVEWWLFGGWAVDFHVGTVTRDHADIEIFVRVGDVESAREALVTAGFTAMPALYPNECQPFLKHGQEVGIWFLTENEAGVTHTPGRWSDWPWAQGSFDSSPINLQGIDALVMSPEGMLDLKQNFHAHRHGAPLRDKDRADIEHLERVIAARESPQSSAP
jgi:hypothetical protein